MQLISKQKAIVATVQILRGEQIPSDDEMAYFLGLESTSDLESVYVEDFVVENGALFITVKYEESQ
jgi:hypothetical protein